MTLVEKFTAKYGINPIKLVEDANLEFFGYIKSLGLKKILEEYIDKKDLKIELTDEFFIELVECFAEAGEKFPENQKAPELVGASFEIPNQKVSIPKSKGTLENFKGIVGADELRPIMMGVYVSEDGFLVGTDAHKLVKLRTNEFSSDKGKIIDLAKYIKSKGKILDFIDGKYPNYEAVIPKENLEEKALSTYAFYNLAKSAQGVKRLTSNEVFNINLRLKTDDDKTEVFAFSYIIMLEALTFAMANGWDFFTLEYSTPSRAVVLNFGDGNLALVMPVMVRDNEVQGAKVMTPKEIEENYRLGLSNQKASKSKATKPARPSAPVISEPYKKFDGNIGDTTYVSRRQIASITLTSGEVLGANDVIDGFYRVNKKMAHGGSMYAKGGGVDGDYSLYKNIEFTLDEKDSYFKDSIGGDNIDLRNITYVGNNKYRALAVSYSIEFDGLKGQKLYDAIYNSLNEDFSRNDDIDASLVEIKILPDSQKMAHGGGVDQDEPYSKSMYSDQDWESITRFLEKTYTPSQTDTILRSKFMRWVSGKKNFKNFVSYFNESKKYIDQMLEEEGEYADGGSMYADGGGVDSGRIPNNYKNKTESEIWQNWTSHQKHTFLQDHCQKIGLEENFYNESKRTTKEKKSSYGNLIGFMYIDVDKIINTKYSELPRYVKLELQHHVREGQYAHGGSMYAGGGKIDPIDMAEVESSAIFYTEKGKWSPEPTVEKFENQIREYQEMKRALDNKEIRPSRVIGTGYKPQYVRPLAYRWIEERTLIAKRAIEILKERMGGAKSSSHEVGDTVTFNSVMGGTKTGTIVSKIGEEGFRIKTDNGFATVKKSAIV